MILIRKMVYFKKFRAKVTESREWFAKFWISLFRKRKESLVEIFFPDDFSRFYVILRTTQTFREWDKMPSFLCITFRHSESGRLFIPCSQYFSFATGNFVLLFFSSFKCSCWTAIIIKLKITLWRLFYLLWEAIFLSWTISRCNVSNGRHYALNYTIQVGNRADIPGD